MVRTGLRLLGGGQGPGGALTGDWVRELASDGGWSVRPVSPDWILDLCRERVGEAPVAWAVAAAYENARRLALEIPDFGASDGGMRSTRLGTESSMLHVLLALSDERRSRWFPAEQVQVIQDLVHRRIPRQVLLSGIRFAHAAVARTYLEACSTLVPADGLAGELQRVSSVVIAVFDELTSQGEVEYSEEDQRWTEKVLSKREMVDDVLGRAPGEVAPLEKGLDYGLRGRQHLAAVAWQDSGAGDLDQLEKDLVAWFRRAGAQAVLTVRGGPTTLWGWGSAALGQARSVPSGDPLQPDARVAYSAWRPEIQGFRASHREARAVEHVMAVCPGLQAAMIPYSSVNLLSVLLSDLERATDFAWSELGALAGPDSRSRELRATVGAYLELRSPKAVAEQQFLARGTVNYRLRQAEEILGRSLESRPTELSVAILLVECLPMARAVQPVG